MSYWSTLFQEKDCNNIMKHFFKFIFVALVGVLMVACGSKSQQAPVDEPETFVDPRMDPYMTRSHTDTLAIMHNVNEYLRLLKEEKIDSAMAMLYEVSGDTVVPISGKRKEEVMRNLEMFPVLDYTIDELQLFSETNTQVRYSIEFFKKPEGDDRPNTLQCVLNPRRVGYYWYLTIADLTREPDLQRLREEHEKKEAQRIQGLQEEREAIKAAREAAEQEKK